ncbi:MFS transporter [Glutamicibacter sp. NPDC087344]|uniref:MFS transporter n=1 Tax=Glutamicibacter sp. NPDC087344 TaxID=3363994 RepID=UPI0037F8EAC0
MTQSLARNPWWTASIAGMASFLDAGAIVATGTALVLFQDDLGLSGNMIGQLSALLTVMIAIGALIGGRLGDRYGRRRVFTVTMLVFVAGAAALMLAPSVLWLYVGLILLGFAAGADLPVSMAMIAETAPEGQQGKMITFSHVLWMAGMLSIIALSAIFGGMGATGARILYGFLLAVAILVLIARTTLPESPLWLNAHQLQQRRKTSEEGNPQAVPSGSLSQLFRSRYVIPLIAVGLFYVTANILANTNGQFGTYLYVNVAGSTVQTSSLISLVTVGVSIIGMLTLMKLVDTKYRMPAFGIASLITVVGLLIPTLFGVTVPTLAIFGVLFAIGGAIAGEPMFKVWAQELFPTLLRSTAQGTMIAVTRGVVAVVALFTPALISSGPQNMFIFLIAATVISCAIGFFWVARLPKAEADAAPVDEESPAELS